MARTQPRLIRCSVGRKPHRGDSVRKVVFAKRATRSQFKSNVEPLLKSSEVVIQDESSMDNISRRDSLSAKSILHRHTSFLLHLFNLLYSSENTSQALKYMKEEMNSDDLRTALSQLKAPDPHPDDPELSVLSALKPSRGLETSGMDRLAQVAALRCDNKVLSLIAKLTHRPIDCTADMVAMLMIEENPHCALLNSGNIFNYWNLHWLLRHIPGKALEMCIDRKSIQLSVQSLRVPYEHGLKCNELTYAIVHTLLVNGMPCPKSDLLKVALNGNMELLELLLCFCRTWNASELVDAVKSNISQTSESKLKTIKWITSYLADIGLSCTVECHPSDYSSYVCSVGDVRGHLRERTCKLSANAGLNS